MQWKNLIKIEHQINEIGAFGSSLVIISYSLYGDEEIEITSLKSQNVAFEWSTLRDNCY